jgi:hypothetical protein
LLWSRYSTNSTDAQSASTQKNLLSLRRLSLIHLVGTTLNVNIHDPNIGRGNAAKYRLGRPDRRLPSEALPKTYGDFVARYRWHAEAKSLAPDGARCTAHTCGLLRRMPVFATGFGCIGKETDRRWEHGEDISLLKSKVTVYRPNETAKLATDYELQDDIRRVSIRVLARAAGVTENSVKAARRGDRLKKQLSLTFVRR